MINVKKEIYLQMKKDVRFRIWEKLDLTQWLRFWRKSAKQINTRIIFHTRDKIYKTMNNK